MTRAAVWSCYSAMAALQAAVLLSACGGTSDAERPSDRPPEVETPDLGSRPVDCSADDQVELQSIENFETGAATGWFTNTDVCQLCNDLATLRSETSNNVRCLMGEAGGCEPEEVVELLDGSIEGSSPAELQERIAELLVEQSALLDQLIGDVSACMPECSASATPDFFVRPVLASPISDPLLEGARCGSSFGLHVKTVLLRQFGGTAGRSFPLLDVRDFDGIAFWARKAPDSPESLRVSVSEVNTDENAPVAAGEDPVCLFEAPPDNLIDFACDKFGRFVALRDDWQFFTVPFAEMRQNGFGKAAPFLDTSQLTGLSFDYSVGRWDFWLDDISFYRAQ